MSNLKKTRNIILTGAALLFTGYIISICYKLSKATQDDPPIDNNILPKDYLNLFFSNTIVKDSVRIVFHYKHRSAIGLFSYDGRFAVEIIKIDSSFKMAVNKIIVEKFENSIITSEAIYIPFDESGFKTDYQLAGNSGINNIYMTMYGDSIKTVLKNDSIASYYLKLKNLSVTYNISLEEAIFADASQGFGQFSNIPIDVAFVRKNGALYFVLLAPKNAASKLDPNFLFQLIKHSN